MLQSPRGFSTDREVSSLVRVELVFFLPRVVRRPPYLREIFRGLVLDSKHFY